jgi:hypothetical protein
MILDESQRNFEASSIASEKTNSFDLYSHYYIFKYKFLPLFNKMLCSDLEHISNLDKMLAIIIKKKNITAECIFSLLARLVLTLSTLNELCCDMEFSLSSIFFFLKFSLVKKSQHKFVKIKKTDNPFSRKFVSLISFARC